MPINRGHVPLGKRIPLENIGCRVPRAGTVVPHFEFRPVAHMACAQFANRINTDGETHDEPRHEKEKKKKEKTPRCIYYDCHAPVTP